MLNKKLEIDWKKILIIGNWSYKNLWDELILIWTIKLLQQQGKKIFIQAHNSKWLKKFLKWFVDVSEITFLTEIPKWIRTTIKYIFYGEWRELLEYRKIDSVIVGWGEILTEENKNSYWYWIVSLLPVLISKTIKEINIYLMWGIQIPKKKSNLFLFKKLLKWTNYIYARDFETVENLKQFGYYNIDFFMDTAYFARDWQSNHEIKKTNKPYIIVNVNKNGERFLDEMKQDIAEYDKKWYHIYYVAVSKWSNAEYNDKKYHEILNKFAKMELLDREKNFQSFINVLSWAEIVISTRLHLFLIANFLWIKTKVYPYQKKILKMKNVLESLS